MKIEKKEDLYQVSDTIFSTIKSIEDINQHLTQEEKEELGKLKTIFQDWNDRLSDKRYKVAIIGTEKAGKSTFSNALLNKNFLPEAKQRCTFTTTIIEPSQTEDYAKIQFYTKEEFVEAFNELCKDIGYDRSYEEADLDNFQQFLDENKSDLVSRSKDDIESILKYKEDIEQYLTGELKKEENLEEAKTYIHEEIKARAVKNIIIKSTEFGDTDQDMIIYDVPGYDSPVLAHLEQAKQQMREADIVIMLVSIADKVSFVKSQLDFLYEVKDRYGQNLADKIILCASKFDVHIVDDESTTQNDIQEYYDSLQKEAIEAGIYKEGNFFKVSALGYLEKKGIVDTKKSYDQLQKHNFTDGIDEVKNRLKEFLNGEALEMLNKKFEEDKKNIGEFLDKFKEQYNPHKDQNIQAENIGLLVDKEWDRLQNLLIDKIRNYQNDIRKQNFHFDDELKKQVKLEWITTLKNELDKDIKLSKNQISIGNKSIEDATELNIAVRKKLYGKSLDKIVTLSTDKLDKETDKYEDIIVKKLVETLIPKYSFDDKEKIKTIFQDIIANFKYEAQSYKPLILRFLNGIFEILILSPIQSKGARVDRVSKYEADIRTLLHYDDKENNTDTSDKKIIRTRLGQLLTSQKEGIKDNEDVKVTTAKSYDDVKKEILKDLDIFENIFGNIILKAIKLEDPFKSSFIVQIEKVLEDINKNSESSLKQFVRQNIKNIAPEQYGLIVPDEELTKKIDDIISNISIINQ